MKKKSNYTDSFAFRLSQWLHGEYDPFAGKLENRAPAFAEPAATPPQRRKKNTIQDIDRRILRVFRTLYRVLSIILCLILIALLLVTVSNLPPYGDPSNPAHNEVMDRYIEKGTEETGVINAVTGMILSYRAFDTFGETCVLFIASCCVLILLDAAGHEKDNPDDTHQEPQGDGILGGIARLLTPIVFLFGLYIILNGHLSPGGGFSGGAMIGAGLILYVNAFGVARTHRFFNHAIYQRVKVGSLVLYGLTMTYYFITGGNGLVNLIPLGTPGNLLSSGMILPINIYVGLEVACTMYAFFALFRRGEL